MTKIARTYRFSQEIIEELKKIVETMNVSETEVVSRAIHNLYLQIKGDEQNTVDGSIVSLAEYQRVRDMLDQIMYKAGELQGKLEERENIIKLKDELIQEYKNILSEFQNRQNKKWWKWWKS